jgi:alpha-tubulin suppressor-like RCC1 family protein
MRFSLRVAAFVAVLAILACGGSETDPKMPALSIGRDSTLLVDEIEPLAAFTETGQSVPASSITWLSSAPSVASIDASGHVTALAIGQTTISATSPAASAHITIAVAAQFLQIATGETHSCGLTGRHQVYCWGMSARGELGSATPLPVCAELNLPCSPTPVLAVTLTPQSLAAGAMFSCALDASGTASCWGANFYGQLGDGTQVDDATPQTVQGSHHFVQLVAGRFHACGITDSQDAYCWGWDRSGQLGTGDVSTERCTFFAIDPCSTTPRLVIGGHKWAQLSADERATCGLTTDGDAFCWGLDIGGNDGLYCQTADDTQGCSRTPIAVGTANKFKSIIIGDVHRCEQKIDETLECWGAQYWGAFGNGSLDGSATPVTGADGLAEPVFVSSRNGMCFLDVNHHARCWGDDSSGQVGDGVTQDFQILPIDVFGGWSFEKLQTNGASDHVCGILTENGRGVCWGRGVFGQLGTGVMHDVDIPAFVQLVSPSSQASIAAR